MRFITKGILAILLPLSLGAFGQNTMQVNITLHNLASTTLQKGAATTFPSPGCLNATWTTPLPDSIEANGVARATLTMTASGSSCGVDITSSYSSQTGICSFSLSPGFGTQKCPNARVQCSNSSATSQVAGPSPGCQYEITFQNQS